MSVFNLIIFYVMSIMVIVPSSLWFILKVQGYIKVSDIILASIAGSIPAFNVMLLIISGGTYLKYIGVLDAIVITDEKKSN